MLAELLSSAAGLMLSQVGPVTSNVIIALDASTEEGRRISIDEAAPARRAGQGPVRRAQRAS